ncbi:hypothetical protein, partial [Chitiniphilus shinanonensis]|uniref:hypothetical protein n=1 Tax=Chitiniphilus shinanonensis TaxID=553088 RepID=UPI0033414CEC
AAVGPTQVADSTEALIRAGVTAAALRTGALDPAVVAAQGGSGAQVALAARAQSGLPLSEGGEPFVFDATVDPLLFGVGAATPTPQEVAEAGGTGEQIAAAARAQAQAQADSVDEDTAIAGRSGLTPQEVAASGGTAAQIAAAALAEAGLPAAGATTATGTATLGATPAAVLDNLADQAATARVEDRTAAEQLAQAQAQAAADAEQQLEDELLLDAAFTSQTLRNAFQAQQLDGLLARREIESALGGLSGLAANAQAEDVSRAAPDAPLSALSELAARSTALPDGEQMLADELLTAALPEPAQPQPQATTPTTTTVAAATQPDPRQALEQRLIHDTLTPGLGNTQPYMVYGAPTNPAMNPVRDTYVPPDNVVNPVAASAATDEVMTGPLDTAGLVRAVAPRR